MTATPADPEPVPDEGIVEAAPASRREPRRARFASWFAPTSAAAIYLGIFLLAAGFGLLAFTWSKVAGTAIVPLQLPYVVSGACTGLGLLIVGALTIYLGVKRRDAWERDRRLEQLAAAFEAIAATERESESSSD